MAKSGSERTKAWRQALIDAGYKQKAMLLSPQALKDLAAARKRFDVTDAETVARALSALQAGSNAPPAKTSKR